MNNEKNIIGEVNVTVKAGLSVDDKTARICMDLLSIYFKQGGAKGAVLRFDEYNGCGVQALMTEEAVDKAMTVGRNYRKED